MDYLFPHLTSLGNERVIHSPGFGLGMGLGGARRDMARVDGGNDGVR